MRQRRGKHPAPARHRWAVVVITTALAAATRPIPDELVRWGLFALIVV